jgi:hypothetical protein
MCMGAGVARVSGVHAVARTQPVTTRVRGGCTGREAAPQGCCAVTKKRVCFFCVQPGQPGAGARAHLSVDLHGDDVVGVGHGLEGGVHQRLVQIQHQRLLAGVALLQRRDEGRANVRRGRYV